MGEFVVSSSGDIGYSRGTYTSRMIGPKGEPLTEPGKWVSIWRKQSDGEWRIVVDINDTDIMPPVHAVSTASDH
jgi:ketosteroid isomerase-like protein